MRKGLFILFAFLLCTSFAGQAQVRFGVKAGVNIVKPSLDSDIFKSDNFTGYQIGPTMEFAIPLTKFDLDVSVLYSKQGLKIEEKDSETGYSQKMKQHSIDVPINLKYKFDLIVVDAYVFAGPYVRFNIDDNFGELKDLSENYTEIWKSKSLGAGLNFGAGVEILSKLQVGFYYQLGLTDDYSGITEIINRNIKSSAKSRGWAITAAYFF